MACELVVSQLPAGSYRAMLAEVERRWVFMHGLIVSVIQRRDHRWLAYSVCLHCLYHNCDLQKTVEWCCCVQYI